MRLGINVPDKIIKSIKELDPEANVSQICREALTSRSAALERARTEISDEDMDDIIQYLGQSPVNTLIEPDWAGLAWQDAREWITTITPQKWNYFLDHYDRHNESSQALYLHAQFCGQSAVKGATQRQLENEEWFWRQAVIGGNVARQEAIERAQNIYRETLLAYVHEVRSNCLQIREEKTRDILIERENTWSARQKPELPLHLQG